jgi:hypothetical protein
MNGTRESLLNQLISWATSNTSQNVSQSGSQSNISWVYGLPGIGKTLLAHSICANLLDQGHLAGAFFCRRDDPDLNEPRNILPTLIYKLAIRFPLFRSVVAERLRQEPNLTPESMNSSFFLDLLHNLPRHPEHTLVFVIDALDECGDRRSRPVILNVLTHAATQAPWLKMIITSRPEVDIQRAFQGHGQSLYSPYDLAADQEATVDLRTFARSQFDVIALEWHLPAPWPEDADFDKITSLANGLFIFVKTLALVFEGCKDPKESLKAILQGSASAGLKPLHTLYSSILKTKIAHGSGEFQRVIGVLLTTSPHRPLCEATIAELAGVELYLVKRWVDALSSLLYRGETAGGVVRARHLSISDYFVSNECPSDYRVSLEEANLQLSTACMKTMNRQLRFNICKLEDSRLANADVEELASRINENIPDALQYSALYWSDHLCFTPYNDSQNLLECLKELFEGLDPLFWIEVLSIMGMVPVGAPSLRRLISWLKVSRAPVYHLFICVDHSHFAHRKEIRRFLREFRMFVILPLPSTSPSLSAHHTLIFPQYLSYPYSHLYQQSPAHGSLKPSRCIEGNWRHGQCSPWRGLDTLMQSIQYVIPPMDARLPLDPMTKPYESGMWRLVLLLVFLRGTLAMCTLLLTLLMGSTSFLDLLTGRFESGMPGLELQLASHLRGILLKCGLLPALLMGSTSFLDLMTAPFESGMPGLELQLASHLRGILLKCGLLPALLMGSTSFLDLMTAPFESGMPGLELQLASHLRGILTGCRLLPALLMGSTSFLGPMTGLFESGMRGLGPQLASHLRGTLMQCRLLPTLLMGSTSFLDLGTTLFESGVQGLELQLASHLRGILPGCRLLPTLLMGSTSFPDLMTALFESGMRGLGLQLASHLRGILAQWHLLPALLMASTSFPDLMTALFESGMPGLGLQLASHLRGILAQWHLLPTLLMGNTSFLDLGTTLFESGMRGLELQLASHLRGILMVCRLLPTLLMGNTSFLDLGTTLFESGIPGLELQLASRMLIYLPSQMQEGWVKDSQGGLLYWVSTAHCKSLHSPALVTIPSTSPVRSVSLDFQDFVFGINWSQIFKSTQ